MNKKQWLVHLSILNLALIVTHEIDSAFWQEWTLFKIPGGIQVFLILNFLLVVPALYGLLQMVKGGKTGRVFSLILSFGGVFAFSIHTIFIRTGHTEFTLPVSLVLLWMILIVSLLQLFVTLTTQL